MLANIIEWDPAFDWVAVGTLALAAVTFLLARATSRSIAVSERAVATTELELSYSQRPVIAPRTPAQWSGEEPHRTLTINYTNVGVGPALNVVCDLTIRTPDSERTTLSIPTALGPGDSGKVSISQRQYETTAQGFVMSDMLPALEQQQDSFRLRWLYEDVSGRKYETVAAHQVPAGGFRVTTRPVTYAA